MAKRKDGRPRVVVPVRLDPLPYVCTAPDFERFADPDEYEGRHPVAFLPRDGYSQNEDDYA